MQTCNKCQTNLASNISELVSKDCVCGSSVDKVYSSRKSIKCNACRKTITNPIINCFKCHKFFHSGCSNLKFDEFEICGYNCVICLFTELPFYNLSKNQLYFEISGKPLVENLPSFSIQTLLDEMPGQNDESYDFLDTISSKYYTPAEFVSSKIPKTSFSMLHLNIASLQKHFDELITLLNVLEHPFDVIAITETRLHDENPIINLAIDGYNFLHTTTRFFFYKQPGCLGVRPQNWPKIKQHAKQLEAARSVIVRYVHGMAT